MKKRNFKRLLAGLLAVFMVVGGLPSAAYAEEGTGAPETTEVVASAVPETSEADSNANKIDVIDFGAEQLDSSVYNNLLNEDIINSWAGDKAPGTTGCTVASFTVNDAEGNLVLRFNDGGYPTTHRIRTTNTNLSRYDDKSLTADGVVYTGMIYSNKSATKAVNLQFNLKANDKVTVVVSTNSAPGTYCLEDEAGNVSSVEHPMKGGCGVYDFYAASAGLHTLYTPDEKMMVARIYIEHFADVTVTGTVSAPSKLADYSLVFTNTKTGVETVASVADGQYSVSLAEGYTYDVSLENANGFIITSDKSVTVSKDNTVYSPVVEEVSLFDVTGVITGIPATELAKAEISFVPGEGIVYVPEIAINEDGSYSVVLEKGVEYTLVAKNVDDYSLLTKTMSIEGAANVNIEFAKKPVYNVSIKTEGVEASALSNATLTFVRHSDADKSLEEDYVYSFTGIEGITLRDGIYTVKVSGVANAAQKLTSNLTVYGADVEKTVSFKVEETETAVQTGNYDFTVDAYTGQTEYNGMTITGGAKHGATYGMMNKNGSLTFNVSGAATVKVNVGYTWDLVLPDGSEVLQTSDGGMQTVSFEVSAAGTVEIKTGSQATTYISSVKVEYKDVPASEDIVITVGQAGCDYTTINAALEAARKMKRAEGQRIVISIEPGDYEEMLVIDIDNLSLVNAKGDAASLELTNKGVDIAENAVRITSYYGHGYSYYSMDANCKYDEEVLAVNRENGYLTKVNPGSGTTDGSYWNATVSIKANIFKASGIIFENSFNQYVSKKAANDIIVKNSDAKEGTVPRASMQAGDTTVQNKKYVERAAALAIYNNVSKASFDNCKFVGRQDTLYGGAGTTAAFYNCKIYGGTDYIFGGMTAVFAKCDLVANTMEDSNDTFYITAAQQKSGRGYLMYNCNIVSTTPGVDTASENVSKAGYLGRPWQAATSEVVFYATNIGESSAKQTSLIAPAGWLSTLSGTSDNVYEIGSNELTGVDNSALRVDWSKVNASYEGAKLSDGTEVSVAAFLGDWDAFEGKDMTIVLADKLEYPTEDEDDNEVEVTEVEYVLEASSHEAFAAGAKADGEEEKLGTDNYFTFVYSSKTKIDSSSKTFDDGYTSGLRFNMGAKAGVNGPSIKFTTENPAVVKVWWVEGGDDNRQITILDAAGTKVAVTNENLAKNALAISTLNLEEAGTYYLGGDINSNYIFKVSVTELVPAQAVVNEYSVDATKELTAFAAGAKTDGEEEKVGTDGFFTVLWSAKSKVDGSSKNFEDGYAGTQRINLGGAATTSKNSVKFTTEGVATVKVWWVEGGDDKRQMAILDAAGNQVAVTDADLAKNDPCVSTFELANAGTYYLGGATNNNYIFKIEVTDVVGGAVVKPARADWDSVSAPVINAEIGTKGDILVTVSANVGYDGADKVTVAMSDAEGKELKKLSSSAEKDSHVLTFVPDASGDYTFVATLIREVKEGEEELPVKLSEKFEVKGFVLPLKAPAVSAVANKGNGSIEVSWDAVKEAKYYVVVVDGEEVLTTEETSATVTGLEIGKTVAVSVKAARTEEDKSVAGAEVKIEVKASAERTWGFSAYGTSTNTSNNGYVGSVNDGKLTVYSEGGKGKIVPASNDGLAFYYTKIDPETENFTLTAKVHVDNWTLSNGQEGFGLMVADTIGKNGDTATVWNNSLMAVATKIEYYHDGEAVTSDTQATKITMKLGLGYLARLGATADGVAAVLAGESNVPEGFTSESGTLESSCVGKGAGTYNVIGNYTAEPGGDVETLLTDMILQIQRNNTGYVLRYLDAEGNVLGEKLYYDLERTALTQLDAENIYLGFFASRNARITVTDVVLTTIDPKDDEAAGAHEIEEVYPVYTIESSEYANSDNYELVYYGNVDGVLTITDAKGKTVVDAVRVTAGTKSRFTSKIKKGVNTFTVTVTPDEDFVPGEYKVLTSYETAVFTHSVEYRKLAGDRIYVSPEGTEDGKGNNKKSPVDIYTAVKFAEPGQTIVLAAGTYDLSSTVKVDRGINGTAEKIIKMIADPEAASRPVLDFGGRCAGMVLAGNYWYFNGFDVTNSKDAEKGIVVAGNNNTLEDIRTYKNGNTGIQISRYKGTDNFDEWPANNLILNCTSYLNADRGYEDADGFAAKLTVAEGNVFDGCISAFNADDGWDLYAKVQSGSIGKVVIKNSVAFMNGYVIKDGAIVNAGNGNGFKMGGESLSGHHTLINSVAFANKAKGIDSNSCPDIEVYNSTAFDNESYNVAFYTNNAINTDFSAEGVLSYKKSNTVAEQLKFKGTQDENKVRSEKNYYVTGKEASANSVNEAVSEDWFVSLDKDLVVNAAIEAIANGTFGLKSDAVTGIVRNSDNTINMNGFLVLTANAPEEVGARLNETPAVDEPSDDPSEEPSVKPETNKKEEFIKDVVETTNKVTENIVKNLVPETTPAPVKASVTEVVKTVVAPIVATVKILLSIFKR